MSKPASPSSPFTKAVIERLAVHLREQRELGGWSIRSLAQQCRMSSNTIRVLEADHSRIPALKTIDKIASALNVETCSLLGPTVSARVDSRGPIEHVLAGNLVRERELRQWTQEKLSQASGVGREHLAHIERGEQNPTLDTLVRLAVGLDISVDALLKSRELED
ncbi:helix-turn-helix domain-containing protein [Hydrogenophaga sp.]|uniref:helix-turn-helix domain-containing protein n=1 Tax=Hydrogenophaga sp. TaxID=1904254 RepID=UPI00391D35DD